MYSSSESSSTIFICLLLLGVAELPNAAGKCGCESFYRNKRHISHQQRGDAVQIDDMILVGSAKEFFMADNVTDVNKFRAGSTYGPHKWPGNKLNYLISDDLAPDAPSIRRALREFQQALGNCVTFNEISSPKGSYVHVYNGGENVCFSSVGRIGGMQALSLGRGCIRSSASVQHEFMHALGFFHEQSRPDRDHHIIIDFDRTESQHCNNYLKCKACQTVTPYNTRSIMHHSSYGFGCNGAPTIHKRNKGEIPPNYKLHDTDIQNVKWLYGCR